MKSFTEAFINVNMRQKMSDIEILKAKINTAEYPELLASSYVDNKVKLQLFIPDDLSWFKGHFPEQPVLPGVVQVHWAGSFSKLLFENLTDFKGINHIKYKTMILPNTQLDQVLEYKTNKQQVVFTYQNGEELFSSGILQF